MNHSVYHQISVMTGESVHPISEALGNMIPYPSESLCRSVGAVTLENFLIVADGWAQAINRYIDKPVRVLDIGCGCGRTARLLVPHQLIFEYTGFDPIKQSIDWCQSYISTRYPKARFLHFDIYSNEYNPNGTIRGVDFVFPVGQNTMNIVFAGSLFTHLLYDDSMNYLKQIYRCLSPGGVGILSTHNETDSTAPFTGNETKIDIEDNYFISMCQQNGLKIRERLGKLCGQELFVVEK